MGDVIVMPASTIGSKNCLAGVNSAVRPLPFSCAERGDLDAATVLGGQCRSLSGFWSCKIMHTLTKYGLGMHLIMHFTASYLWCLSA
jgi:hypothetical protein